MAQLDIYPTLEELFSGSCEACAGMGEALRCGDDGTWAVIPCPECAPEQSSEQEENQNE